MLVDKGKYLVFSRQGEMLANCHQCIERCLALLHRRRCRVWKHVFNRLRALCEWQPYKRLYSDKM